MQLAGNALYTNLLVDTLFERLPLRQFDPVEKSEEVQDVVEEVIPEPEVREEIPAQMPVLLFGASPTR